MGTGMEDGAARLDCVRSLDAGLIGELEILLSSLRKRRTERVTVQVTDSSCAFVGKSVN